MKLKDLLEQMEKATSSYDFITSMTNGRFTKDGSHLRFENNFECADVGLTTLEGMPQDIGNNVYVHNNLLTSLKGMPPIVYGNFSAKNNRLKDLTHGPARVLRDVYVSGNPLESFEGMPRIGGALYMESCRLTSLHDVHKHIVFVRSGNVSNSVLNLAGNKIVSHVLGLVLVEGLIHVTGEGAWVKVINSVIYEFPDESQRSLKRRLMSASRQLLELPHGKELAKL